MKSIKTIMSLILLATLVSVPVYAESAYVKDSLRVNQRAGAGTNFEILNTLESGDKVEIIEQDDVSAWSKVIYKGKEGWMPTQYLVPKPIAKELLAKLQVDYSALEEKYNQVKTDYDAILNDKLSTDTMYGDITAEKEALALELEELKRISTDAISIDKNNKSLTERNVELKDENNELRVKYEKLKDNNNSTLLLVGASLILVGVLIGLWLTSRGSSRRNSW